MLKLIIFNFDIFATILRYFKIEKKKVKNEHAQQFQQSKIKEIQLILCISGKGLVTRVGDFLNYNKIFIIYFYIIIVIEY